MCSVKWLWSFSSFQMLEDQFQQRSNPIFPFIKAKRNDRIICQNSVNCNQRGIHFLNTQTCLPKFDRVCVQYTIHATMLEFLTRPPFSPPPSFIPPPMVYAWQKEGVNVDTHTHTERSRQTSLHTIPHRAYRNQLPLDHLPILYIFLLFFLIWSNGPCCEERYCIQFWRSQGT